MEEIKLRPKLKLSTEGWRLRAVEMPDVNLYIEPEKTERAAILTVPTRKQKKTDEVELF